MKQTTLISIFTVAIVVVGLLGFGFGAYRLFFARESLFDLEAQEITSITLKKDGTEQTVVFETKEDIEWLVSKLNAIKTRSVDINYRGRLNDTRYSIYIDGANGGGYQLGKSRIRCGNKLYNLTPDSKAIVKEIIAKIPDKASSEVNDSKAAAENICKRFNVAVENITANDGKVEIILKSELRRGLTEDIRAIYDNIQGYGIDTESVTECTINLFDTSGDVLINLTGNVKDKSISIKVNPKLQDDFVESEGPQVVK